MNQSIKFSYELEQGSYAALTAKLRELAGTKANIYIARALNKTATTARQKLAQKAKEAYTVKSRGFKSDMQIKKANAGNLVAEINSTGFPLSMKDFKHSFSRPNPTMADIVKSGLKSVYKYGNKAFVGSGDLNGHVYVRTGKAAKRYKGQKSDVYRSKRGRGVPKSREGLEKLFSKSVPYMIGSDNRVWGPMRPQIGSDLEKYMKQQIKFLIG